MKTFAKLIYSGRRNPENYTKKNSVGKITIFHSNRGTDSNVHKIYYNPPLLKK